MKITHDNSTRRDSTRFRSGDVNPLKERERERRGEGEVKEGTNMIDWCIANTAEIHPHCSGQHSLQILRVQINITMTGSVIVNYKLPGFNSYTLFNPFQLDASLRSGVTLSADCRLAYMKALRNLLTSTFRYINYQ